jgi:hypothetical protein
MTARRPGPAPASSTPSLDRATDQLVSTILDWRIAPDRFIKPGRGWTPRSRFNPFVRLEDVFLLLERADSVFVLSAGPDKTLTASIQISGRTGKASGRVCARTIAIALCQALGIEAS